MRAPRPFSIVLLLATSTGANPGHGREPKAVDATTVVAGAVDAKKVDTKSPREKAEAWTAKVSPVFVGGPVVPSDLVKVRSSDEQAHEVLQALQRLRFGMSREQVLKLAPQLSTRVWRKKLPKGAVAGEAEFVNGVLHAADLYVPASMAKDIEKKFAQKAPGDLPRQTQLLFAPEHGVFVEVWSIKASPDHVRLEFKRLTTVRSIMGTDGHFGFEPTGGLIGKSKDAVQAHFGNFFDGTFVELPRVGPRFTIAGIKPSFGQTGLVESFRFVLTVETQHVQEEYVSPFLDAWKLDAGTYPVASEDDGAQVLQLQPRTIAWLMHGSGGMTIWTVDVSRAGAGRP